MTPEENNEKKKQYEELIKKVHEFLGITPEAEKELHEATVRGVNLLKEWSQDVESIEELPKEIKDLKVITRYNMFTAMSGEQPVQSVAQGLDMAIEAAFNLGKANALK
jgi:hypothetical protein